MATRSRPKGVAIAASVAAVFGLTLTLAWSPVAVASPNDSCLTCHNRVRFDPERFAESVHGELFCGDCHRQFQGDPHGQTEVEPPTEEWLAEVLAVEPYSPTAPWAACGRCHAEVIEEMAVSHHIRPMIEDGVADGAFCPDCHGPPHYMDPAPQDRDQRFDFVVRTCEPCHTDTERIERHGLNPDVVLTYEGSIHGRAARLGSERAPTCVDCHQAHAVVGGDDPDSPLAPQNRAQVCSKCHEGANANFASVLSHSRVTKEARPLEYWVTFFFASLTLFVIVMLVFHMLLDMIAGLRQAFRRLG